MLNILRFQLKSMQGRTFWLGVCMCVLNFFKTTVRTIIKLGTIDHFPVEGVIRGS